jgi:PAS domain S-box-containing protein
MDMTQAFAAGTLDSPSEAPESASELGQLTQSFYAMAAKLKKSTLEWTLAMDAFEDAIYMLNEERHLIRANAAFYKMMKTTPEQAIGRHIIDIAHAEEEKHPCKVCLAQEAWRDFMIIMEADDPENPTGEPIEITGKIIRDSADSATGILMNLHDLTPSRLREQKTRESELKYRLLADYTYDWEAWINPQGDYIYMSPACERITGYTPQEFMTNPELLFELVHPDYREKIHQHCRDENNPEIPTHLTEFAIMTKNGEECWIEHRCLPVFDEQLNYAGRRINNRDITERKQADQQRLELEEQLCQKYKMEAVGVMASGLAHNFNNNLSIILGNVELAQLKQPANGIAIPLLKNAKTAVLRARDLVQNLLTYSRQGTHEKIPIQLSLVIEETINMLGSTIPSTVKLQPLVSPNGDHIIINADTSQIQEILLNLCSNAVHAMEEQGVLTITLDSVELQPRDIPAQFTCLPGPYAKLSIQDSGSGIATDIMEKIFDPFFTTKAVGQGTGMGLSTVRGIVEQHGGLIKVNSTLGQGTTFELYFPAIETKQLDTTLAVQDLPRGSEKILFIDDEEMLANVWSQMLIEYGYQVTTMTDSREALKLFIANADRFDLVITDQTMPEMTGKDLIEQLLKIKPALPTIICTGFSSKVSEEQAKELGASAFLMKPLDLPVLLQTVRQVLDKGEEG